MKPTVVIVGAGPVGLMLACELRIAEVPVVLLERLAEPTGQSRALGLSPRSIEVLAQRGIADRFQAEGIAWPRAHFAGFTLDMARLDSRYGHALMITQARVEALLEERAVELGAEVRRGHEVIDLVQDATGVTVGVRTGTGDDRLRCDYLVGCDGGGSAVRRLAGIGFPGTDDPTLYAVLGDVDSIDESFDIRVPHVHPGGIIGVAPLGPGVFRISTVEYGVTPPPDGEPVTVDELAASIRRVTGRDIAIGEPLWLSRFDDVTRQAERYRAGRVFLAGDAAHVHFPLSGQGMNLGIHDAVNLGWKLAAAVHGWAPPGLLDTYHDERHPVGQRVCMNSRAQAALTFPVNWVAPLRELFEDLLRLDDVHTYLAEMVAAVDVRYPMPQAEPHSLLGCRLADHALTADGDVDSVYGALRTGRGVLFDLSGGAVDAVGRVSAWKDRVDVVTAESLPSVDAPLLLVRPDGHVACTDDAGLATALTTWFGEPIPQ